VHQTDRTIGELDHAMSQLALLANLPANDPTKAAFARTVVDYIGSNNHAPHFQRLLRTTQSHFWLRDLLRKKAWA